MIYTYNIIYQFVQTVMSDLLVAPLLVKDVLSSATTMPGALSVMTSGAYLMLMLYVDNLDTLTRVNNPATLPLVVIIIS